MSFIAKLKAAKVIKNSGWIVFGKIAQMLISFFVGIFMARYLGPTNYGIINTAQAYAAFFLPICSLGLSGIFVKEILEHPGKDGIYLGSGLGARIISSIISMIFMAIIVGMMNTNDRTLQIVCFIYSFSLLFQSFDLFDYWYQSRYESKYSSIIGIIGYVVSAIYKVFLLITQQSVEWFAFSTVLDYAIIAVLYIVYTVPKNKIILSMSINVAKSMIAVGKHLILASLLVMIYAQMDKIMLGKLSSPEAVGLYSIAIVVCTMWTFVLAAIINSLRPNIVLLHKTNKQSYENRIIQLYSFVFWISVFVSIGICICAEFIVNILFGSAYSEAVTCLRIVTWYTGFSYLGVARNIWTVCENKQRYEKHFAIGGVVTNFILNLILIPIYDINGAAIASLLTQVVTNVVMPYIIQDTRENAIFTLKSINPIYVFKMVGLK